MRTTLTSRHAGIRPLLLAGTMVMAAMSLANGRARAQQEASYPSPQVSVRLVDYEPASVIAAEGLERFLAERLVVEYGSVSEERTAPSDEKGWVIHSLLVDRDGRAIGGCRSEPVSVVRKKPGRTTYLCRAGSLARPLGKARLVLGDARYVDGKPVNLGLWLPGYAKGGDLTLGAVAIPTALADACDAAEGWPCRWTESELEAAMQSVESKTLVLSLKYPIEHGI